ncbi:hypothetical protein [Spiroplasma endosymbiont of Ammophila pubescens]|uniref:hypothetical protein n=1 Tax=Spiroplasma endosymbiont of Ammophila pubescens TaxID=3066315 RepID=UPI0032B25F5F
MKKIVEKIGLVLLNNEHVEVKQYDIDKIKNTSLETLFLTGIKEKLITSDEDKAKYLDEEGNIKKEYFEENKNISLAVKINFNGSSYNLAFTFKTA